MTYSFAELREISRAGGFPEAELDTAAAVVLAEHRGHPRANANGPSDPDRRKDTNGRYSIGLFQMNTVIGPAPGTGWGRWAGRLEFTPEQLEDPVTNARAAYLLWSFGGRNSWEPWGTFRTGLYRQYLPTKESTMGRQLWLADALRADGLDVEEVPGWKGRGSETFNPRGIVCHHTADGPSGDYPSLRIVREGRAGLPGPLAQLGIGRSGKVYVVASGRANHAGSGGWRGLSGNSSVFGIEAENTGVGEPWSPAIMDAYLRTVVVLCRRGGIPVENVCGHKEWAPRRKIDPHGFSMGWFRDQVAQRLQGPAATPALEPGPPPQRAWPGLPCAEHKGYCRRHFADKKDGNVLWFQEVIQYGTNYNGPMVPDGYHGPKTEDAVSGFQGAVKLPQTGVVDQRTWEALNGFAQRQAS